MMLLLYASEADVSPEMRGWDCDLYTRAVARAAESLSRFEVVTLLAEIDGKAVGLVVIIPGSIYGGKLSCVTIQSMFVRSEHRKNGAVARRLWMDAKERIGADVTIQVQVLAGSSRNRALYARLGFKDVAVMMERSHG